MINLNTNDMENKEINRDDRLGRMIRLVPPDMPSDDFTDRVMAGIRASEEAALAQQRWLTMISHMFPYAALLLFCVLFFLHSDLPFLNEIAGKNFFTNLIVPYTTGLSDGLKDFFNSRYVTYGFMTGLAGIFLFFLDRYFTRRTAV